MNNAEYTITLTEEDVQHLFDSFVARKKELFLTAEKAAQSGNAPLAEELNDVYNELEELHDRIRNLVM